MNFITGKGDGSESIKLNSIEFTLADVRNVVTEFYTRVQQDSDLNVPFSSVKDWPHHMERIAHFWWTRFGGDEYMDESYSPVAKHYETGFTRELLTRWLQLFEVSLNNQLQPEQAKLWLDVAQRMGHALAYKNDMVVEYMKNKTK